MRGIRPNDLRRRPLLADHIIQGSLADFDDDGVAVGDRLAELPVGGLQIGKFDAAECLVVAGDGLRVVERGGDQVIEIDVLDIERLAHLHAA